MKKHHIIVSHGNCPDGAAAIFIAKRIERHCEHVHGVHHKIDEQVLHAAKRIEKGGQLWLADICCSEEALEKVLTVLLEKNASIGIYEHHISRNFLAHTKLPKGLDGEIVFDMKRCGSKILYETMKPRHPSRLEGLDELIELTNDRDLWINADIRSAELSTRHGILGDDRYIHRLQKNADPSFTESERVLLDYEKEIMMQRMHRLMEKMTIHRDQNGLKYGIMIGEGKASDVCNAAIHKYNLEYVFLVDFNSSRASVRSNETFDCAKYSENRGGGGHERAAGFPIESPSFNP
jgi:oligoribonuclease NrnB/cAMP/cGMP phosphodiesterase (DHH superfamily)